MDTITINHFTIAITDADIMAFTGGKDMVITVVMDDTGKEIESPFFWNKVFTKELVYGLFTIDDSRLFNV